MELIFFVVVYKTANFRYGIDAAVLGICAVSERFLSLKLVASDIFSLCCTTSSSLYTGFWNLFYTSCCCYYHLEDCIPSPKDHCCNFLNECLCCSFFLVRSTLSFSSYQTTSISSKRSFMFYVLFFSH